MYPCIHSYLVSCIEMILLVPQTNCGCDINLSQGWDNLVFNRYIIQLCFPLCSLGPVFMQAVDLTSCAPLTYEGTTAPELRDGNDYTCLPTDTFLPTQYYMMSFMADSHLGPHKITIIGYNLSCSPLDGVTVLHAPSCETDNHCSSPHQICLSQHEAHPWGAQGLMKCSYICTSAVGNGHLGISKAPSRIREIQICEISLIWDIKISKLGLQLNNHVKLHYFSYQSRFMLKFQLIGCDNQYPLYL